MAALGMIYGDIATSPLYVLKFIVKESGGAVSEALVLGAVSLILWALLLLATAKGVLLLLRADNQGEGGHFALFALVRDRGRWLLIPAALGGAALLVDSVLTPALSFTAAVEGIRTLGAAGSGLLSQRAVVFLVIVLLSVLFLLQGLGSRRTGRFLGPVMLLWLLFIGVFGALRLSSCPAVLRAFDPRLGLRFLFSSGNPVGFSLLGFVFLSVTGTEILYANLDYGGRKAITRAWPFILACLCLSYLGQGAWLLGQVNGAGVLSGTAADPFFQMLPAAFRFPALLLALSAAWAAAQTVINGSFTLVSEAIRLDLLPALEIRYPSESIRHEYIPAVNFLMWLLSCAAVLIFRSGQRMASVYGLTIAISMLTTTAMLFSWSAKLRSGCRAVRCALVLFAVLEAFFLAASLEKLLTGGVVTLLFTLLLMEAMLTWHRGAAIEQRFSTRLPLREYLPQLRELRADEAYGRLADNLVYLDKGDDPETVDQAILFSLLDRGPKRAQTCFFVSVTTVGEPYVQRYEAETFGTDFVFRLRLELGYKCSRPLTWYLRDVFLDLEKRGLARISRKNYCLTEESQLGSFRYILLRRRISGPEDLSLSELWAMRLRGFLQAVAGLREEWYTEENTDVQVEWLPLSLAEESPRVRIRRLIAGESADSAQEE